MNELPHGIEEQLNELRESCHMIRLDMIYMWHYYERRDFKSIDDIIHFLEGTREPQNLTGMFYRDSLIKYLRGLQLEELELKELGLK